jgi:hypothetical protein
MSAFNRLGQRRGVAGEIEVKRAVDEVPLGAGTTRSRGEPARVVPVVERGA